MKLFLSFLLLFTFNKAICQVIIEDPIPLDEIDFKHIAIKNAANKSFTSGSNKELEKAFGKAKIKKQRDEVLDGNAYIHTPTKGLKFISMSRIVKQQL
jgi:hypothetical protein